MASQNALWTAHLWDEEVAVSVPAAAAAAAAGALDGLFEVLLQLITF